jgi:hypothetical protein
MLSSVKKYHPVGYFITEMNVIVLQKYQIDTDTFVSIFEYIFNNV